MACKPSGCLCCSQAMLIFLTVFLELHPISTLSAHAQPNLMNANVSEGFESGSAADIQTEITGYKRHEFESTHFKILELEPNVSDSRYAADRHPLLNSVNVTSTYVFDVLETGSSSAQMAAENERVSTFPFLTTGDANAGDITSSAGIYSAESGLEVDISLTDGNENENILPLQTTDLGQEEKNERTDVHRVVSTYTTDEQDLSTNFMLPSNAPSKHADFIELTKARHETGAKVEPSTTVPPLESLTVNEGLQTRSLPVEFSAESETGLPLDQTSERHANIKASLSIVHSQHTEDSQNTDSYTDLNRQQSTDHSRLKSASSYPSYSPDSEESIVHIRHISTVQETQDTASQEPYFNSLKSKIDITMKNDVITKEPPVLMNSASAKSPVDDTLGTTGDALKSNEAIEGGFGVQGGHDVTTTKHEDAVSVYKEHSNYVNQDSFHESPFTSHTVESVSALSFKNYSLSNGKEMHESPALDRTFSTEFAPESKHVTTISTPTVSTSAATSTVTVSKHKTSSRRPKTTIAGRSSRSSPSSASYLTTQHRRMPSLTSVITSKRIQTPSSVSYLTTENGQTPLLSSAVKSRKQITSKVTSEYEYSVSWPDFKVQFSQAESISSTHSHNQHVESSHSASQKLSTMSLPSLESTSDFAGDWYSTMGMQGSSEPMEKSFESVKLALASTAAQYATSAAQHALSDSGYISLTSVPKISQGVTTPDHTIAPTYGITVSDSGKTLPEGSIKLTSLHDTLRTRRETDTSDESHPTAATDLVHTPFTHRDSPSSEPDHIFSTSTESTVLIHTSHAGTSTVTTAMPSAMKPAKLGDVCSTNESCSQISSFSRCESICVCTKGYFEHGKKCLLELSNVTDAQINDTCVLISWVGEASRQYNITEVTNTKKWKEVTGTNHTFCSLTPGSEVNVTIRYLNIEPAIFHIFRLPPSKPRNGSAVAFSKERQECIYIAWYAGPGRTSSFQITAVRQGHGEKNTINVTIQNKTSKEEHNTTICELVPGSVYNVSVWAESHNRTSKPLLLTAITTPSKPVNGSAVASSQNQTGCVDIAWYAGPGQVSSFNITARQGQKNITSRIIQYMSHNETHNTTFCGLVPGSNYTVTVTAESFNKTSRPLRLTAITRPEETASFELETFGATWVTLKWQHCHTGNCDGYVLWDSSNFINKTLLPNETGFNITKLSPGTNYTFYLSTKFRDLLSIMRIVHVTTNLSGLTSVDVTNFPHSTILQVSWQIPSELSSQAENVSFLLMVSSESNDILSNSSITLSPYNVTTNSYGKCFSVSISVVMNFKVSTPNIKWIATSETVPDKVVDLSAIRVLNNRTIMNVTWSAPANPNGVIQGYTLTLTGQSGLRNARRNFSCNQQCEIQCPDNKQRIKRSLESSESESVIFFLGNETSFSILVDGLSPYENYDVSVVAYTRAGESSPNSIITSDQLPSAVGSPKASAINSTCVVLNWTAPMNGNESSVQSYLLLYRESGTEMSTSRNHTDVLSALVCDLKVWTTYEFRVSAVSELGEGEITSVTGRTGESIPDKVTNLTVEPETNPMKPREAVVTWQEPANKNGEIERYVILVKLNDETVCEKEIVAQRQGDYRERLVLQSEKNYSVIVFAQNGAGKGVAGERTVIIPPGILPPVGLRLDIPSLLDPRDPTSPVTLGLPRYLICNWTYGAPVNTSVVVYRQRYTADGKDSAFISKSWGDVDHDLEDTAYYFHLNFSQLCKEPDRSLMTHSGTASQTSLENVIKILIGQDGDCGNVKERSFCNGKLLPDTEYQFQAYMCTKAGCTYTNVSNRYRTAKVPDDGSDASGIAAGVVVVVVLVVLSGGAAIYVVRGRKRAHPPDQIEENGNDLGEFCRNRPIALSEFAEHVDKLHRDSNLGFSEEYKLIKELSRDHSSKIAELPVCKPKNRYTNILPYDHARVKLIPTDDEEGSDYINASFLPGLKNRREFIAAQGPLPSTIDDFWRMIWEQRVTIVVMLTQCVEKGRIKCEQYWPDEGEAVFYGDLVVQLRSQSVLPDYIIRVIDVKMGNQTRMIKHFHFMRWPDHGCPEATSMLLNFVSAVRAHMPHANSGPTLVHCSAGVGRTGTYIALDQLMQQIRQETEVDIFNLVLGMRDCRPQMVQTENQYIYIHDCLADALVKESDEEKSDVEVDEHIYSNC